MSYVIIMIHHFWGYFELLCNKYFIESSICRDSIGDSLSTTCLDFSNIKAKSYNAEGSE